MGPPPAPAPPRRARPRTRRRRGASEAGRAYVVRSGDTLGEIAQRELGSASRWTEIRDLNPGLDPRRLAVGQRLSLPAGAREGTTRDTVALAEPEPARAERRVDGHGSSSGKVR